MIRWARGSDGSLVHVTTVEGGAACDCSCLGCGAPLRARKGAKRRHHFAHCSLKACRWSSESELHLLAKNFIAEEGRINCHPPGEAKARIIALDETRREVRIGEHVVDVLAVFESRPMAVEVKVSNRVSEAKLRALTAADYLVLEVDVTDLRASEDLPWDIFRALMFESGRASFREPPPRQLEFRNLVGSIERPQIEGVGLKRTFARRSCSVDRSAGAKQLSLPLVVATAQGTTGRKPSRCRERSTAIPITFLLPIAKLGACLSDFVRRRAKAILGLFRARFEGSNRRSAPPTATGAPRPAPVPTS